MPSLTEVSSFRVGYILGLGDRHPSNMLLSRENGTVIHIDYGDCFEVSALSLFSASDRLIIRPFRLPWLETNTPRRFPSD